jgi:hypothetical protein
MRLKRLAEVRCGATERASLYRYGGLMRAAILCSCCVLLQALWARLFPCTQGVYYSIPQTRNDLKLAFRPNTWWNLMSMIR